MIALLSTLLLPVQAQSLQVDFKLTVLNSIGEPQKNLFLQIKGYSTKFEIDDEGVILFKAYMSKNSERTAELYFKDDEQYPVKSFDLDRDVKEMTFYINSQSDILRFKQENKQVEIEGILLDEDGQPIEGAMVGILGTGSQTISDEIGLFRISADYNHRIIIRAKGMETKIMGVDLFLRNADEAITLKLTSKHSDYIYNVAEEMPMYYGGMKGLMQYLDYRAAYPKEKQKSGIEGVVVVQFVVEKDGSISQPKIVRHLEPELDSIAYRAIASSPRWIPAKDGGQKVRCRYSMPVAFKIPKPKPEVSAKPLVDDSLKIDGLLNDSLVLNDSVKENAAMADSIALNRELTDSLSHVADSLGLDSIKTMVTDTTKTIVQVEKKVKKRPCAFVRFFRRLLGIKRGEEVSAQETTVVDEQGGTDADQSHRKKKKRKRAEKEDKEKVTSLPPVSVPAVQNENQEKD